MDAFSILSNRNHNIWKSFHKQYIQQKIMKTITEKIDTTDKQTELSICLSPERMLKGRYQQQQHNLLQPLLRGSTVLDNKKYSLQLHFWKQECRVCYAKNLVY